MASKFNIVKKPVPKKDEEDDELDTEEEDENVEEEETEETEDDEEQNKKKQSVARKRMIKFMAIIMGCLLLIFLVMFLISIFSVKEYTYEDIEQVIKEASVAYFKDHPESLPQSDGAIVEIGVENLVAEEKMKDLSEYTKEGVSCTGYALVEKVGEDYVYTPYLNCGEDFETIELYKKIINTEPVITSGYGLYNVNGNYIYRGEEVNNYVQLEQGLWRIVKIEANTNQIVLIKEIGAGNPTAWDDRFNSETNYASGINNYSASRVKEYLEHIYKEPNESLKETILGPNDKTKMVKYNVCVGKRGENEETNDGSIECSQVLEQQQVGLLPIYDYINASVDPNCKAPNDNSCQNYNYLVEKYNWWLATADKATSYKVYNVNDSGRIYASNAISYSFVRPVITLNNMVLYKDGDGTKSKPYILK